MCRIFAALRTAESISGFFAPASFRPNAMRNQRFQLATMNDTEASAADIAAFERDLRERRVRVLIYNSQATEALTQRLLKLAQQSKVPTMSVTETLPPGKTYQTWMLTQLDALQKALAAGDTNGAIGATSANAQGKAPWAARSRPSARWSPSAPILRSASSISSVRRSRPA